MLVASSINSSFDWIPSFGQRQRRLGARDGVIASAAGGGGAVTASGGASTSVLTRATE
jgi:hypothetical protein